MTAFIRNRPFTSLALLLAANLLLLSVQIRNPEGRLLIRSWSLQLFSPVASAVHSVSEGAGDALGRYVLLYSAQGDNLRLREENARLKVELTQLRGLNALYAQRSGNRMAEQQFRFDAVFVPVIWKNPPFHTHRVIINAGSSSGVDKDDAVLTPEGVVGRVWTTTPFTAEIELITNSGAAAGAMLQDSRLQGVVQGDGSGLLRWDFIPNTETVEVGDIVYTSGTDRIYPKGYPIGRVVKSARSALVYRDILVEPLVDSIRLEEVMVVRQ